MRKTWIPFALTLLVLLPTILPAAIDEDSPLVATVTKYREAKKKGDLPTQRALLAPGARMWFEKKEGEGSKLGEEGSGDPWKDWDAFFRSESSLEETVVLERTVRATVRETNDWYRLVDRPPSRYYMTYDFDDAGKIAGVLVHLADFKAWAEASRPGLLETLMPEGKLDPALDKAKLWKSSLLAWRKAAGLSNRL